MGNDDIEAAREYHEATKLSYINLKNKPPLYKPYSGLPKVALPADISSPDVATLDAVAGMVRQEGGPLDLTSVARLLFFSAGMVRKAGVGSVGEVHYRAAASAGALYPIEVYLACGDIQGLKAGLYHFSPEDFSLHRLRQGNFRGELSAAAGGEPAVFAAPATLIFTAVFWRSAWKYRTRSYRYCFWDCGTMLANLLSTAWGSGLSPRIVAAFVDERVNALLGVPAGREAGLCLVPVGIGGGAGTGRPHGEEHRPSGLIPADGEGPFLGEVDYPEIRQVHTTSSMATEAEVSAWRGVLSRAPARPAASVRALGPADIGTGRKLGEVIVTRGSTRRFSRDPIPMSAFSSILRRATSAVPADFLGSEGPSLLDIHLIVNAVDGLPPGSYRLSRDPAGLMLLQEGGLREVAGHLCFEQALGADAAAVAFFMTDLEGVLARFGNRGYRAAQLEAGILGGRLYLCAHSLGLGASGLTFYDDDVTDFFGSQGRRMSTMFVVALGVPDPRNRVRPYRSRVGVALDALARGAKPGSP